MIVATIVLNKTECLEDLLHNLSENGITGATILESTGMARTLTGEGDLRFMSALRLILDPERENSRTIFMLAEEDKIPLISKITNEVTGGLNQPDTGILFCAPITYVEGLER